MTHTCHWNDCEVAVPPKMWGCKKHWFMLPKYIRDEIWAFYRPGQEVDKQPSEAYLDAAMHARAWIADYIEKNKTIPSRKPLSQESLDKLNALRKKV